MVSTYLVVAGLLLFLSLLVAMSCESKLIDRWEMFRPLAGCSLLWPLALVALISIIAIAFYQMQRDIRYAKQLKAAQS